MQDVAYLYGIFKQVLAQRSFNLAVPSLDDLFSKELNLSVLTPDDYGKIASQLSPPYVFTPNDLECFSSLTLTYSLATIKGLVDSYVKAAPKTLLSKVPSKISNNISIVSTIPSAEDILNVSLSTGINYLGGQSFSGGAGSITVISLNFSVPPTNDDLNFDLSGILLGIASFDSYVLQVVSTYSWTCYVRASLSNNTVVVEGTRYSQTDFTQNMFSVLIIGSARRQ